MARKTETPMKKKTRDADAPGQVNTEILLPDGGDAHVPVHSDMPRLERIRRRRRMRRIRVAVVCAIGLAAVLAYFTGIYGASLALLGDMFDSVTIALTPGEGYPVDFKLSDHRMSAPLAGGFAALGDKDVMVYAASGNVVRNIQHGYARPSLTAGNTRFCIYNRTGTELRVESRSRTLYEKKFDAPIELCAMSPNGSLAVFTKSRLYVYDPMFEELYYFSTPDLPTAMAFASDNKRLAVGTPYSENGALGGSIYLMDSRVKDVQVAMIRNTEGLPLKIQYLPDKQILVIYDTFAAVYNTEDGAQLYRYDYNGRVLQSADVSAGKNAVLLFGDGMHSSLTQLVVLDTSLAEAGFARVNARATGVSASRTAAFVMTSGGILTYGLDGAYWGQTLTEEKPLALLSSSGKMLLLCEGTASHFVPPEAPEAQSGAV